MQDKTHFGNASFIIMMLVVIVAILIGMGN